MTVSKLEKSMVPAVETLERENFSRPWRAEDFEYMVTDKNCAAFAALEGDTLVGYIGLSFGGELADIANVCVHKDYRRRGIADALMISAEREARDRGCTKLFLEVRASNTPAISLYKKSGFVQISVRPRYYDKPIEDALVMVKELKNENTCN